MAAAFTLRIDHFAATQGCLAFGSQAPDTHAPMRLAGIHNTGNASPPRAEIPDDRGRQCPNPNLAVPGRMGSMSSGTDLDVGLEIMGLQSEVSA